MLVRSDLYLMVDPVHDQAQPVSPRAFERITAPRSRVMARNCVALFLTAQGRVLHIESIAPARRGPLSEAALWLGKEIPARFDFEAVDVSLDDMRVMITDAATYMRLRPDAPDWWLSTAPLEEITESLRPAKTLADLHARIRFPERDACLELL